MSGVSLSRFYHVIGWSAYILVILLGADKIDTDFVLKSIAGIVPVMFLFYNCTVIIFPRYFPSKKYLILGIITLLTILVSVGIRYILLQIMPSDLNFFDAITFWNQFRMSLLFVGISLAYWFAVKNYENESNNQQLQRDYAAARLTVLKHQINPHFLYNTLSLIYTRTYPLSEEVAGLIGKLSDMMRYALEDGGERGLVTLDKEINHIKQYIDILQSRYDQKLHVQYTIAGDPSTFNIAPLILITFVENAFKHGKLNDADHPIKISIEVNRSAFLFEISNSIFSGSKDFSSGIGLQNVMNRLNLLYPHQHQLDIMEENNLYSVKLKIKPKP